MSKQVYKKKGEATPVSTASTEKPLQEETKGPHRGGDDKPVRGGSGGARPKTHHDGGGDRPRTYQGVDRKPLY